MTSEGKNINGNLTLQLIKLIKQKHIYFSMWQTFDMRSVNTTIGVGKKSIQFLFGAQIVAY
jgi:hypothetical protein